MFCSSPNKIFLEKKKKKKETHKQQACPTPPLTLPCLRGGPVQLPTALSLATD